MVSKNTKGQFFWYSFKISSFFTRSLFLRIIGYPFRWYYKFFIQWILGIDIPDTTKIGKNFCLFHGQGLVINEKVVIGCNVIIRHNTTIGNAIEEGGCPVIGDNVNIGANVVIIGNIKIGNNSIIGAGSVILKDVPENSLVVGNPGSIIKYLNE